MSKCILITGGIRSGKSRFAQELAKKAGGKVLFVATAEGRDEEMKERIEKHKRERPAGWRTLEVTENAGRIIKREIAASKVVILDSLSMLISNILDSSSSGNPEELNFPLLEKRVEKELDSIIINLQERKASFIIVSVEVGMSLVPPNRMGRYFQELHGKANQRIAQNCDEIYLMVSGIPLKIK